MKVQPVPSFYMLFRAIFIGTLMISASVSAGDIKDAPTVKWSKLKYATARAYTFNFGRYGPGNKGLHAYGPYRSKSGGVVGLNPAIRNSVALTKRQARKALRLVQRVQGDVLVSKCAFPRHGVVFFDDKETPIASVSVCFECGDILVWPKWDQRRSKRPKTYSRSFMRKYDKTMVRWKRFFERLEDMPPDWTAATDVKPPVRKAPAK